jgi:hypothetical protein
MLGRISLLLWISLAVTAASTCLVVRTAASWVAAEQRSEMKIDSDTSATEQANLSRLSGLNWRLTWANRVYIFAGAITLAATFFIYTTSNKKSALEETLSADKDARLRQYQDAARVEIAKAQAAGQQATAAAAAANQLAQASTQQAEALRVENSKLQLQLAQIREPRNLTMDQFRVAYEAVKPFAGVGYDTALTPNDNEVGILSATVDSLLSQAGWRHVPWTDLTGVVVSSSDAVRSGQAPASGVFIVTPKDTNSNLEHAAKALSDVLNNYGIATLLKDWGSIAATDAVVSTTPSVIHILFGRKPLFSPEQQSEWNRLHPPLQ